MTVKWFQHVDQIITVMGSYRRGNDDKNAAGDKGEVDEEDDVEEGEVAQSGEGLAVSVGAHQGAPETGCQQGFPLDMKSYMSMKSNMVTLFGKEPVGRKKAR